MDYQLIVRIPMKAMDDIAAREKAQEIVGELKFLENKTVKLQRLEPKSQPIGIALTLTSKQVGV